MFTGIVEEMGSIREIIKGSMSIKLSVSSSKLQDDMKVGDSIAVNGICLTVTSTGGNWFTADVMPETMRKTGLNRLRIYDRVNLERAMRLKDRLGGHIVTGHIDGTGTVVERTEEDNALWLTIEASPDILKYVVPKGSVALDGTSLTVAKVDSSCFKVSLIPLTAGVTTLGFRKAGDVVNIECDVIGKYVEKLLYRRQEKFVKENITVDFLRENGFV